MKDKQKHSTAAAASVCGLVTAAFRRHFAVRLDDGKQLNCVLRGRSLAVACGDRVEAAQTVDDHGVILSVCPRVSLFYRSDSHREKLIAANVSQVIAVVAPDPPYDEALIDRWIIAAESNQCRFLLVLNKTDLPAAARVQQRLQSYVDLGYAMVSLSATQDASTLQPWIDGERSILVGQSGMGKSTLVNALLPQAQARIGELSTALKTGRHTTSNTQLYLLNDEGTSWIADSPGLTEFGLGHVSLDALEAGFVELRPLLGHCKFRNCRHETEPGCAIQAAVLEGAVSARRVSLLRQLSFEVGR